MGALALLGALLPQGAGAQEVDGSLRLMSEPHSYVDVVDAFDADDPFDINLTVGVLRRQTFGNIQREQGACPSCSVTDMDLNRSARNWVDIARHEHVQNILNLGLDLGIFRDLAIYGRLPIVLSDDRQLTRINGRDPSGYLAADDTIASDPAGRLAPPLFEVPDGGFQSPTRSGLDHVRAGLAWSIMNQNRDSSLPTWMLMIEGRFNFGDSLRACKSGESGPQCRRWQDSAGSFSFDNTGTDAGMTRGTNALRIETRSSWRTRYVEPYGGLMFQIEWPGNAQRSFLPANNISGFTNERPPILGRLEGGLAIIPWENRGAWQRFTVDVRFSGTYYSEGHGYSPLFDALGTSDNRYLTEVNIEGDPDGVTDLRQVPFFGLTDMQSHAELGGRLSLQMQAARYVRFALAAGVYYTSPFTITYADACNPNAETPEDPSDPRRGTCRSGIINPHHRPAIDLPGQRFRADEQIRLDLSFSATAQF